MSFHARAPEFQNHEGDEEPEEGEDQNDQGVNDFYVAITKWGTERGIFVDCSSIGSELHINNVTATDKITVVKNHDRIGRLLNTYCGPDFPTLDERLQSAMA